MGHFIQGLTLGLKGNRWTQILSVIQVFEVNVSVTDPGLPADREFPYVLEEAVTGKNLLSQ